MFVGGGNLWLVKLGTWKTRRGLEVQYSIGTLREGTKNLLYYLTRVYSMSSLISRTQSVQQLLKY